MKLSKNFLSILEFPINLLWICQKPKSNLLSDWILVQGFRMPNLVDEYKTIFLGKWGKAWNSPKLIFPILEFPMNLRWSLWKHEIESSGPCNIGSRLENVKFGLRIQNHFSGKARETLELFKKFFSILELPINLFWSLLNASVESSGWLNIGWRI